MRLAFTTEYDGSRFSGFQRQKNAISIQQNLEEVIEKITQEKKVINYAGRTDAGVHALSQVFDFTTGIKREEKNWIDGINSNLPDAIAVTKMFEVPDDFHSRFSAVERSYTYVIYNSRSKPLFFDNCSHWDNNNLDIDALNQQAKMFIGKHDFTSFRSSSCSSKNPIKSIRDIEIESHDKFIFISIHANAFLHNMVRIMVGTLLDIAKGEINLSVEEILSRHDRSYAGKTVSAKGLFFLGPKYDLKFNIDSPTEHLLDRFKR